VINPGRFTAKLDDEFVVFLIGMRINRPWKVREWLPVAVAMPKMLRWLDQHPEAGLQAWHNAWIKGPAGRPVLAQLQSPGRLRPR